MVSPLSLQLREGTKDSHRSAERSEFIRNFFKGNLSWEEYRAFLLQLYHVYSALEGNQEQHRDHDVFGKVYFPALNRREALAQDLDFYFGSDSWKAIKPNPATKAYARRIQELAETWPEGLVAHHYTRYLGDLSGGQALKKIVARTFELPSGEGLAFYEFPEIDDHAAFKDAYRTRLDAMPVDEATAQRIVDEANRAFDLNRAVFDAMETAAERQEA